MTKSALNLALLFIALLLLQVVIFNNLILLNTAIALVFIYFIISLPSTIGVNMAMTLGFLVGLSVDVFSDTLGLNALCCTLLAFVRIPILHLYTPRNDDNPLRPSIKAMGSAAFIKYTLTMSLIYCAAVFAIEAFSLFNPHTLLMRITSSTLYTCAMIYGFDALTVRKAQHSA